MSHAHRLMLKYIFLHTKAIIRPTTITRVRKYITLLYNGAAIDFQVMIGKNNKILVN